MGATLDRYLSSFGQALSQLANTPPPAAGPPPTSMAARGQRNVEANQARASFAEEQAMGAPQPGGGEGAGTFEQPSLMTELPMLPGETFEQNQAAEARSREGMGAPTQLQAAPAPTFEQPGVAQVEPPAAGGGPARTPGSMEIDDVRSPEDMFAAANPEQIEGGVKALETALEEGGSSLDEAYAKMTGGPPDTRLTREEKGQLLMEFGLGILAQGAMEGEGLAAVGASGLSTLQSAREMKEAKRTRPTEERQAQLEMDLTEAQIEAARRTDKEVTTNSDGNMIIVDTESGRTITVTDAEGNPVAADPDNQQRYEREVARDMYRAVRCTGKSGDELERCETAALAYAAGGAGTVLAFPEIMDRENTEAALGVLLDDDARFTRHLIPSSGERKTIEEMTGSERAEVVRELSKVWGITPEGQEDEGDPPPPGWNAPNVGISQEEARQITRGQKVPHPSGVGWIANREGRLVRLDENNEVMGAE